MTKESKYVKDLNRLKGEAIADLEELLDFSKELIGSANFKNHIKAKTVIRHNTFSAMYQRADAVLALTRANQGNVANIIVRSMWETLAEYDFINLEKSNVNLEIRLATESKQQLSTWIDVQRLRKAHPQAETWQSIISDTDISQTIALRQAELENFSRTHPNIKLSTYKTLFDRLRAIDDSNLSKDSNYHTLTQFDYRSVYSLLSSNTHSTVVGNMHNTKIDPKTSIDIRLDAPLYETLRATYFAYKLFLRLLQNINRQQRLRMGDRIKELRAIDELHDNKFKELQDRYSF